MFRCTSLIGSCAAARSPTTGSFGCTRHTPYNDAAAHGQIQGTTFSTSWVWEEDDYTLTCPMLTGTLQ